MKIALTSAFVFRGKHYKAGDCLELEDRVASIAIDDGAAEQVFDVVTDGQPAALSAAEKAAAKAAAEKVAAEKAAAEAADVGTAAGETASDDVAATVETATGSKKKG